jgi:heterotetrameric sarcosine oxidase delta subunit
MRIPCPHCGLRSHEEFAYHGDATLERPIAPPPQAGGDDPAVMAAFGDYVYLRDNKAGAHRELWFHAMGCHAWIVVLRDTRTHEVFGAWPASRGHGPLPQEQQALDPDRGHGPLPQEGTA